MDYRIINRLVKIILDIADVVDEKGENGETTYIKELSLGYRALSGYLRQGAKAVIELQESNRNAKDKLEYKNAEIEELKQVSGKIFGDIDLDYFSDEEIEKIKAFITKLIKEAE